MRALRWLYLVVLLVGLPTGLLWMNARPQETGMTLTLRARMPESGGWSSDYLEVPLDESLTFRLTSDDVVHGFAVARTDFDPVDLKPGVWTEAHWIPTALGTYTFYCTRWCGPNHWRMTGEIAVVDPSGWAPTPTSQPPARYITFDIDIDARNLTPRWASLRPSAERGAEMGVLPTVEWQHEVDPDLTTPLSAWSRLRHDPALGALDDSQVWDLLAYLWVSRLDAQAVDRGLSLYATKCAACHGMTAEGDGVMAKNFQDPSVADFTGFERMAGSNSVILEGKIIRGGMGTGMPYWGAILESEEISALVDAIWWMAFDGEQ